MPIYITRERFEEMVRELEYLKTEGRRQVAKKIQEAREKGDLSENAEYAAAKEEQIMLEKRILQLEQQLADARIIDTSKIDTSTVQMLCKVRVQNLSTGQVATYQIVSDVESNSREGKISASSPIGRALLGKRVGDEVEIQVPAGRIRLKILEITV